MHAKVKVKYCMCVCVAGTPLCPDVSVKNGSLGYWNQKFEKNTAGTVVIVKCQTDYQPVQGHSVAICNLQGHWDPNPPDCGGQYTTIYPLATSFPITVHSASLPQFRAVLCLFMVMSLQTRPRMLLEPLYSSSVIMEGNFQEMLSSLAFKMAAGLDLCLLVVEVALEIALFHVITVGVASILYCLTFCLIVCPLHLTSFSVACYPFSSFLKSITLTFLTQSLSYQEPA